MISYWLSLKDLLIILFGLHCQCSVHIYVCQELLKSDWLIAYIFLRIKTMSEQFWPCDTKLCRRLNNDINIRKNTTSLIKIQFSLLILRLPTTTEPDPLSYIPKYYFEITSAVGLLSFWVRELFSLLFKTIIVMSKGYTTKTLLTSDLPALHFRPLHFVNKVPLHFPFQCLILYKLKITQKYNTKQICI